MKHPVKMVKTYQYVTIGNKNSTHFEAGKINSPERIFYDDETAVIIFIQKDKDTRCIPLTNVQFFDLQEPIDLEAHINPEEVTHDKPKRGRPRIHREGTETETHSL